VSVVYRSRYLRILFCLAPIVIAISLAGQRPSANRSLQLYAIAATPHAEDPYPVTLYRIDQIDGNGQLDRAREVVPQQAGSDYVRASGNVIVFPYPNRSPNSIAIVHTDDPMRVDNVKFSQSDVFGESSIELAEPPTYQIHQPRLTSAK
jgi:hypothetical protein